MLVIIISNISDILVIIISNISDTLNIFFFQNIYKYNFVHKNLYTSSSVDP